MYRARQSDAQISKNNTFFKIENPDLIGAGRHGIREPPPAHQIVADEVGPACAAARVDRRAHVHDVEDAAPLEDGVDVVDERRGSAAAPCRRCTRQSPGSTRHSTATRNGSAAVLLGAEIFVKP